MKTYEVTKISGQPDWEKIPVLAIDSYLWSDVRSIVPSARVAWDQDALYVRMEAIEPHILRRFTGDLDMVCQDSCLEFFFCPEEGQRYFNFEVNPNGAIYVGFGGLRNNRFRLYSNQFRELFSVKPFEIDGGWGIELRIPVSFIQIYVPDFQLYSGLTLRANFYKCGDETQQVHYMSWNPVELPKPDYHQPDFFGSLILK